MVLCVSAEAAASAATTLIPTGLQAAGDGATVFLCLPEVAKSDSPEFAIWYHFANQRVGAAGLWKTLYPLPLLGHPACITTMHRAAPQSRSSTLTVFFHSGTGWNYSLAGKVALPPLPTGFRPVTACDSPVGLTVLGELTHPMAAQASATSASHQPLQKSTEKLPIKATSVADAAVKKPPKPIRGYPWQLLQLHDNRWRPLPLPDRCQQLMNKSQPVLVEKNGLIWLFLNSSGRAETIRYWQARGLDNEVGTRKKAPASPAADRHTQAIKPQTAPPDSTLKKVVSVIKWTPIPGQLAITASHGYAMEFAANRGIVALVASKATHSQIEITGGFIRIHGLYPAYTSWTKPVLIQKFPPDAPLTNIAAARDGDGINLLVLGAKGDLSSLTLETTGKQIYGISSIAAAKTSPPESPVYPQFLVLVLVTLLIFSLWQRKTPTAASKSAKLPIAQLRFRLIAALIDMALAAIVIIVVFKLYNYHAWQPIIHAMENILAQPDLIFSTPPLVMWLSLYELHVILGEALVGRSVGKAIVGIQVVDLTGKPASPLAILIRNLIRIPEIITVFLFIFMFVSDERQRLGDLIARTIVIKRKK